MGRRRLVVWVVPAFLASCGGAGTGDAQDQAREAAADAADEAADPGSADEVPAAVDGDAETGCWVLASQADPPEDPLAGIDVFVVTGGERELRVRVESCGTAVPGATVTWAEVDDPDGTCLLSSSQSTSGADGIAFVRVTDSGQGAGGDCVVESCTGDGPCMRFRVRVGSSCPSVPLIVGFGEYAGRWPEVDAGTVFLYKKQANGKPTCADIPPDTIVMTATDKKGPVSLLSTVQFPRLPNFPEEPVQHYTVRCFAAAGAGAARAYGCVDDVQVEACARTFVTCPLEDLRPRLVGSYDLETTADLVTGLPPAVDAVLDLGAAAFQRPLSTAMLLACDPAVAPAGSAVRWLCEAMFQDPTNPSLEALTPVGEAVAFRMRAIVESLPAWACSEVPPTPDCPAPDPAVFGNDTSWRGLQALGLQSVMTCVQEPDLDGIVPPGGCRESWEGLVVRGLPGTACPAGDPWCRDIAVSLSSVPGMGQVTSLPLDVAVDSDWRLSIARHPADLKYGAILGFVVEKLLLPTLFGEGNDGLPAVDSWEAWLGSLLSGRGCLQSWDCCEAFGAALAATEPGVVAAMAEGACDGWIASGGARMRDLYPALDRAPSSFRIGTSGPSPCPFLDSNRDMRFDTLGSVAEPCPWEAQWMLGAAGFEPLATFTGQRQ